MMAFMMRGSSARPYTFITVEQLLDGDKGVRRLGLVDVAVVTLAAFVVVAHPVRAATWRGRAVWLSYIAWKQYVH
jgi:hypothetical protein